jgi:hypothetical protein
VRSYENEPFVVNRDVRAVIVPAGAEVTLHPGQAGYITQALGGSFTVYMEGNLFRISGEDADAIASDVLDTILAGLRSGVNLKSRGGDIECAPASHSDAHAAQVLTPASSRNR